MEVVDDGFGETRLSREKAKRAETWIMLEAAFDKNEVITGHINGKVKGGFTVDINEIRAFLPGSLVDIRPLRETAHLEGKPLEFKVIKLDQKRNNVVVSRRAVLEQENSVEREALLSSSAGRPGGQGYRQEPHRLRCVRRSRRRRRSACTSPTWHGGVSVIRARWSTLATKSAVKILKFDREKNRVSPRHEAAR